MTKKIAILGASGYTGSELVRIATAHPDLQIVALSADRKAGQQMAEVFPHLRHLDLPPLVAIDAIDLEGIDLAFCALPHGVSQSFARTAPEALRIVDLSADFRLRDPAEYARWYGQPHAAPDIQPQAVFGLPEYYREALRGARIAANTGCYVATSLLPLICLVAAGAVDPDSIVIDAKSGVSGAGRSLRESNLFSEVNEGFSAYGVAHHRHMGELDQELSLAAGRPVAVTFTPHLLPMTRGMMATIYARGEADTVHRVLSEKFADEPFVQVLPAGQTPATQHVRGSNQCHIGVVADRRSDHVIIVSVLDNLMKGASGQAVQCANLMLGLDETAGLALGPIFP